MKIKVNRRKLPRPQKVEINVKSSKHGQKFHLCQWCGELFPKSELREETDLGLLCEHCIIAIQSRGEHLTFNR